MIRAVIADDLTGAADTGVAFGRRARVTFDPEPAWEGGLPADVLQVRDSETRDLAATATVAAVARVCEGLPPGDLYLKIDSTLRGSCGAAVEGALQGSGRRLAVVAASLPEQGRTVHGGVLHVDGRPGLDVARALAASTGLPVFAVRLSQLHGCPPGIAVLDAGDDADLGAIAARLSGEMLPVGSAGLARALAASEPARPAARPPLCERVVVLAGSASPVTAAQLDRLSASPRVVVRRGQALEAMTEGLERLLGGGPAALVATGGETALAACRALGVNALWPRGELAPGLPWSEMEGREGTWLVTKAGGFGGPQALEHAVRTLLGLDAGG